MFNSSRNINNSKNSNLQKINIVLQSKSRLVNNIVICSFGTEEWLI